VKVDPIVPGTLTAAVGFPPSSIFLAPLAPEVRVDNMRHSVIEPHGRQPVEWRGRVLAEARLAVILVHGRGGSAHDMLALSEEFDVNDVAFAAPQAAAGTWYPHSFLAPIAENEPGISSGIQVLSGLLSNLAHAGLPSERVALIGFSQGACLALEFAARHAQRYAAIVGLTGGLIGPPGTRHEYSGSFQATPVLLGTSDVDQHVPVERVREAADVFRRLAAAVDLRVYPRMGHTVNRDEIAAVRDLLMLSTAVATPPG
jgi:predicted esterase